VPGLKRDSETTGGTSKVVEEGKCELSLDGKIKRNGKNLRKFSYEKKRVYPLNRLPSSGKRTSKLKKAGEPGLKVHGKDINNCFSNR